MSAPRSTRPRKGLLPALALVGLAGAVAATGAQQRTAPTYTPVQAQRGNVAYEAQCASCRGSNLDDGPFGPPLKGPGFMGTYGARSVDGLFTRMRTTMPSASPGSWPASTCADILASVWTPGSVDPALGLAFLGTGNTYDTGPLYPRAHDARMAVSSGRRASATCPAPVRSALPWTGGSTWPS